MKKKPMYCYDCGERTVHSYVGKESAYEGSGLIRCFAAIIASYNHKNNGVAKCHENLQGYR